MPSQRLKAAAFALGLGHSGRMLGLRTPASSTAGDFLVSISCIFGQMCSSHSLDNGNHKSRTGVKGGVARLCQTAHGVDY